MRRGWMPQGRAIGPYPLAVANLNSATTYTVDWPGCGQREQRAADSRGGELQLRRHRADQRDRLSGEWDVV